MTDDNMLTFQCFAWQGKPIYDIKQWARERGEKMVRYEVWMPYYDGTPFHAHSEECPESFFNNMRFSQDHRNIRKYQP